jgi:hypothetical protein
MNANIRAFEAQPSDRTPLFVAAKNSRVETVDLLLGKLGFSGKAWGESFSVRLA